MTNQFFRFTFKPAQESQRELIHTWLKQDYIAKWIHGVGLQSTVTGLEKFFQYLAEGKSLDHRMTITQHWIGYDGDRPIVYLLTSNIFKNEDSEYTEKFIVNDMLNYDESLLEKWSYGLDRDYPRYCPQFNRDLVRMIIRSNLRRI